jgi:hypothetical protein
VGEGESWTGSESPDLPAARSPDRCETKLKIESET